MWGFRRQLRQTLRMFTKVSYRRQNKHNKTSAVAEMGDRLATVDMARKVGNYCAPFRGLGDPGPHLTLCRLGRGLPLYQVAS